MKVGSLFTGYGGLDLALLQLFPDAQLVWVADPAPGPSKVLAHRHPDVPNLGDITQVDWSTVTPIEALTGGSPCQDLSIAGGRLGMTEGTRSNLWHTMKEAVLALQPRLIIWENVQGSLSARADSDMERTAGRMDQPHLRALGCVLGDLDSLGYDSRWKRVYTSEAGAAHNRARIFLTAIRREAPANTNSQ